MKFYGVSVISEFLRLAILSCIFLLSCQSKKHFIGDWEYQESRLAEGPDTSWRTEPPLSGYRLSINKKQIIMRSAMGTRARDYKLVGDSLLIAENNPQVIDSIIVVSQTDQLLVIKMNTYPSFLRFKRSSK